jgi:nucleotide-binding universal stress UspA family protein
VELASRLNLKECKLSVEERLPPGYAETVCEIEEDKADEDSYFARPAGEARSQAALHNVELECSVVGGHGVKAIVEFAREGGLDLLMIGYAGHSRTDEHLWGGTSQDLTRLAP